MLIFCLTILQTVNVITYYSFASQKHIYKLVVAAKLEKVHLIGQLVYIALSDWLAESSATF